jgi:cytochrome b
VTGAPTQTTIKVWDPFLRAAHWTLFASVAAAWLTRHDGGRWHEWLGYAALAVVLARIAWGWVGPHHARFGQFVRSPGTILRHARQLLAHAEPRYVGHNPLGACMIAALMLTVVLVSVTGWLFTTDAYWGVEWVEELHEGLSNLLLALVGLHVAGIAYSSLRHRENLVGAMLHGTKRAPAQDDVA